MAVDWEYYNGEKFEVLEDKYLPAKGEGDTMATQIVTAVTKLVYKWYNDGDVFDNVVSGLDGWANDLSSYANWLLKYVPETKKVLYKVEDVFGDDGKYENVLKELADTCFNEKLLSKYESKAKHGSIYSEDGPFAVNDYEDDDEEDEDDYDYDEDDYDDEYDDD